MLHGSDNIIPLIQGHVTYMAEGVGFEPTTPITQGKHLAGARTRPLCDPSIALSQCSAHVYYSITLIFAQMYSESNLWVQGGCAKMI
jgi:hypothetical protein